MIERTIRERLIAVNVCQSLPFPPAPTTTTAMRPHAVQLLTRSAISTQQSAMLRS